MSSRQKPREIQAENERLADDLSERHLTLQRKYKKLKRAKEAQDAWIDTLANRTLLHRKFIAEQFGEPPEIDSDYMTQTRAGTLAWYRRPAAHYAPQVLLPDHTYIFSRFCWFCGLHLPSEGAYGKCVACPKKAWY